MLDIDQCYFGLNVDPRGLSKKPTRIMTNDRNVASALRGCRCPGDHRHVRLEGSIGGVHLTKLAQEYPRKLCRALVRAVAITCSEEDELGTQPAGYASGQAETDCRIRELPDDENYLEVLGWELQEEDAGMQRVHTYTEGGEAHPPGGRPSSGTS